MPDLPNELAYLWAIFQEVKTYGEPLTYQEISSFCHLTGERLNEFEVGLIRQIDRAYKAEFNG